MSAQAMPVGDWLLRLARQAALDPRRWRDPSKMDGHAAECAEILNQAGGSALGCIGAKAFYFDGGRPDCQALVGFRINICRGTRHWVEVRLDYRDTYDVRLVRQKRRTRAQLLRCLDGDPPYSFEEHRGVYCDQLGELVYQLGLNSRSRSLALGEGWEKEEP